MDIDGILKELSHSISINTGKGSEEHLATIKASDEDVVAMLLTERYVDGMVTPCHNDIARCPLVMSKFCDLPPTVDDTLRVANAF